MSAMRSPSVRPAIRRLAIAAVIVLTPFAVHAVWDYIEIRRLVREIEAIKAKGEPVNQAQAGRGPARLSSEEKQGASYYVAAAALASTVFAEDERGIAQPWDEWLAGGTEAPPDLEALDARLAAIVDRATDPLRLAEKGNSLPFGGFSPGTEFNYRTSQLSSLSRLLAFRTLHLALSNRGDDAAQSALHALKFRRTLRDVAWYWIGGHRIPGILSLSSPSPEALARLQAALEEEEAAFSLEQELARERATHIDVIWRRYYGIDPDSPHVRSVPNRSVAETFWRPLFTHRVVAILRQWAELMEAARKPWPEKSAAMNEVFERYPPSDTPPRFPFLAPRSLMRAAFWYGDIGPASSSLGTYIKDRCARAAVAIERYRRDHAGQLPERLDDLVPAYLREVPMDPRSGGPLRYTRDAASYTIYSVGPDGKDDGGDLVSELRAVIERGWGRREIRGRDEGVRVLLNVRAAGAADAESEPPPNRR